MHSTDNEILEIVDSDDNVIGTATRAGDTQIRAYAPGRAYFCV